MSTLNYLLNLTDRMSSTLQKIGVNVDSTKGKVSGLKGEVQSLNGVNLDGFAKTVRNLVPKIGLGMVLGKTIKDGMEQEMRDTSFEVLFGGVDNAKRMIDDISIYAAKSPYGKVGISEATQMMAGFGIAQDKIMPNLEAIGDIAMGDVDRFKSLTLAFSQMSSTGKLTGQDLLQMINASFNPLEQMSKTTGKSIGYLTEQMAKGAISSEMVTQAFQDATKKGGLYHGMIDKISNTAGGQWRIAMNAMSEKLLNLYQNVLQPLLLPALKRFNQFLDDPIGTISKLFEKITSTFPVITAIILGATAAVVTYKIAMWSLAGATVVVNAMKKALWAYELVVYAVKNATTLWEAAQWLLNVALNANPIGIIIAAIVALIAVIAYVILSTKGWGDMWKHTMNAAKFTLLAFVEAVKLEFNVLINGLLIGINKIKEGWYKFREAVGIGDSSENQKMLAQISADTEKRKQSIIDGAKKTVDYAKQAGSEFSKAANSLKWEGVSFSSVANKIKGKLGISAPTTPGTEDATGTGGGTGGYFAFEMGDAGKDTANSIATGGSKTTHITVNIGEMGNHMKVVVDSVEDGAGNIRDLILDELTRALAMAQGQAY